MNKIRIITDSACDIPLKAKLKNVDILGFYLTVGDKSYEERYDISCQEFYDYLETCTEIPKTAHITMMRYGEKIEYLTHNGVKDIIIVTINGSGSATYDAAVMAKKYFEEDNPDSDVRITVIDSRCYSMGYGYPVMLADEMIQNGANSDDIIDMFNKHFSKKEILLSTYTLKFMKKSGRISARSAFVGEALGLKPVILMKDGGTSVIKKVRGDNRVIPALIECFKNQCSDKQDYIIGYTDPKVGREFYSACKKRIGYAPVMSFELGSAVAINAGNHCLGITYLGK